MIADLCCGSVELTYSLLQFIVILNYYDMVDLPPNNHDEPVTNGDPEQIKTPNNLISRYWRLGIPILLIVVVVLAIIAIKSSQEKEIGQDQDQQNNQVTTSNSSTSSATSKTSSMGDRNSADPVEKGKALANGNCEGTGSKPLTYAPMRTAEMSIIIPYGLMAGGHVTPIDHQYYWGKEQFGQPDMYDVLAPADGKIVEIQYRDRSSEGKTVKGDYRVVITYSCTFFSYFDLITSLDPKIAAQLPEGWEKSGQNKDVIQVSAGQVVGKVGGQSLDFAVWDTEKPLKNLLIPAAYNVAEPWKIVTVPPLDYFTDAVKAEILPLYARTVEPRDGVIDQDIEGTAMGNWFKVGTYGYAGSSAYHGGEYWGGHLSLVKDHIDPSGGYVFSIGNWKGQAQQFGIINPSVKPEEITVTTEPVKYQIGQWSHTLNGEIWMAAKPGDVKFSVAAAQGTVLVQLMENHLLKAETFPGKTPAQVTGFTDAAILYNRGDDAVSSN